MKEREKSLECLKACVLALRKQGDEIQNNPELAKRWTQKAEDTKNQLEALSDEDKKWFDKEWSKWLYDNFGEEIKEILLKS